MVGGKRTCQGAAHRKNQATAFTQCAYLKRGLALPTKPQLPELQLPFLGSNMYTDRAREIFPLSWFDLKNAALWSNRQPDVKVSC